MRKFATAIGFGHTCAKFFERLLQVYEIKIVTDRMGTILCHINAFRVYVYQNGFSDKVYLAHAPEYMPCFEKLRTKKEKYWSSLGTCI